MLEVQNLHFSYPDRPVLRGIDLSVSPGQAGFLVGPSGCGKSTLLRCIAGLASPTGIVRVSGHDVSKTPTHQRGIGLLFQEPALFPHLNVLRNVGFGLSYRGVARAERNLEARRWLELVGLAERANDHVDDLSGGQRQRVALARTLAAKPQVVLLDEPFASLDRTLREDLGERVKTLLHDQGVASLWVSHDEREAATMADATWSMQEGQLC